MVRSEVVAGVCRDSLMPLAKLEESSTAATSASVGARNRMPTFQGTSLPAVLLPQQLHLLINLLPSSSLDNSASLSDDDVIRLYLPATKFAPGWTTCHQTSTRSRSLTQSSGASGLTCALEYLTIFGGLPAAKICAHSLRDARSTTHYHGH